MMEKEETLVTSIFFFSINVFKSYFFFFFFLENGFYKVENIDGKGENAGYQHFLLFPSMLLNSFLQRLV